MLALQASGSRQDALRPLQVRNVNHLSVHGQSRHARIRLKQFNNSKRVVDLLRTWRKALVDNVYLVRMNRDLSHEPVTPRFGTHPF